MNAITLWGPWATLIADGYKTIETRSHDRFRNLAGQRIAIHAAKRWAPAFLSMADKYLRGLGLSTRYILELRRRHGGQAGHVLCTAQVAEARWLLKEDEEAALCHTRGLFGLVLDKVRRVDPPVPATGRQGVWDWTPPMQICRRCGCTEHDPCLDGFREACSWAERGLCSACV